MTKGNLRRVSWMLALPACLLIAATGLAHPWHDDALTTLQAVMRGKAVVRSLVEKGEPVNGELLDETWKEINGRTRCSATPLYYLVSLENLSRGKTLYVLLDHSGRFRRARFDDGFAELKFSSFPVFPCERW